MNERTLSLKGSLRSRSCKRRLVRLYLACESADGREEREIYKHGRAEPSPREWSVYRLSVLFLCRLSVSALIVRESSHELSRLRIAWAAAAMQGAGQQRIKGKGRARGRERERGSDKWAPKERKEENERERAKALARAVLVMDLSQRFRRGRIGSGKSLREQSIEWRGAPKQATCLYVR